MCNEGECPCLPDACPSTPDVNGKFARIAEDKWYSRLTTSAKNNYLEMGLVQLSICVFTGKSGNLNVDM
jgi:hypothetical protein